VVVLASWLEDDWRLRLKSLDSDLTISATRRSRKASNMATRCTMPSARRLEMEVPVHGLIPCEAT
jgi:hypothetical protein